MKILHFYSIDGALGRESHLNSVGSGWSCSNEAGQTDNAAKSSYQTGNAERGAGASSSHCLLPYGYSCSAICLRYCPGVVPVVFLNVRMKFCTDV